MKLTKIESYEIQAFAFRVMTGYVAPGKDASPLADEAPYEERCAAFDEWRNEHAPCILAMLHGFEALIDRDDEPTGPMLDERDRLRKALEQARPALEHAATICDGVPTRDPGYLGQLVNVQPNGSHGYRLIHDARDVVRAALESTDAR